MKIYLGLHPRFKELSQKKPICERLLWIKEGLGNRSLDIDLFHPSETRILPGSLFHYFSRWDLETFLSLKNTGSQLIVTPTLEIDLPRPTPLKKMIHQAKRMFQPQNTVRDEWMFWNAPDLIALFGELKSEWRDWRIPEQKIKNLGSLWEDQVLDHLEQTYRRFGA